MGRKRNFRKERDKKVKAKFTIDDEGATVEMKVASAHAMPGWGNADVPEGMPKEECLTKSLDIALGILYNDRVHTVKDLADRVVEAWKIQANYTYEEFGQACEKDKRFQVIHHQIVALADEEDPIGIFLDRIDELQARWMGLK